MIIVEQDGLTALHTAVIGKKEAVISHLLRKGANPHVKDKVRIKIGKKHTPTFFLQELSFYDFVAITGWCYTTSLCCSSWCYANCEVID